MSQNYEKAKEVAEKILNLEIQRKEAQDELKIQKEELINMIKDNNISSMFEFNNGIVFLDTNTTYNIADGLKEETLVKSKSPDKLSDEFIEDNFVPDLKLSKKAKKAIKQEDSEILSVLVPVVKESIKIKLS